MTPAELLVVRKKINHAPKKQKQFTFSRAAIFAIIDHINIAQNEALNANRRALEFEQKLNEAQRTIDKNEQLNFDKLENLRGRLTDMQKKYDQKIKLIKGICKI